MKKRTVQITAILNKPYVQLVIDVLRKTGIGQIEIESGRAMLLQDKKGLFSAMGTSVIDDPVSILSFIIPEKDEKSVLNYIAQKAGLDIPGRGSVFSQEMTLLNSHLSCQENQITGIDADDRLNTKDLAVITCIVQKGEGNPIAMTGLDTGSGIPIITYGTGTGFRDKLGLWRITIPADKEIISFIVNSKEVESLLNMMVDAGNLDKPGKGFIYYSPVKTAMLNTKLYYGMTHHAASQEQIIAAIDEIRGGTDWRQRELTGEGSGTQARKFLTNMNNIKITCNEGFIQDLTRAAMAAGAGGATINFMKSVNLKPEQNSCISPAREVSNLIVSEKQIEPILTALEENGLLTDQTCGQVLMSPVPKACTYLGQ